MKENKIIIIKLIKEIQQILITDDNIPISSAKAINKNLMAILNLLK